MNTILIFSLVLWTILGITSGLECYSCKYRKGIFDPEEDADMTNDPQCEWNPTNLVNCSDPNNFNFNRRRIGKNPKSLNIFHNFAQSELVAVCGKYEMSGGKSKYILRYCDYASSESVMDKCEFDDSYGTRQIYCTCPKDKCNFSPLLKPSLIIMSHLFLSVLIKGTVNI